MKESLLQKAKAATLGFLFITAACVLPGYAAEQPKDKIDAWIQECPYIGLVAKEVSYGPITLEDFDLDKKGRIVVAQPGEVINGAVNYKVESNELDSFHLHHIILGIKAHGAQNCISHALGIWDEKGKAHFSLTAPTEPGVYEVRFDYQTAMTCKEAMKYWNEDPPSSKATIGIIIIDHPDTPK